MEAAFDFRRQAFSLTRRKAPVPFSKGGPAPSFSKGAAATNRRRCGDEAADEVAPNATPAESQKALADWIDTSLTHDTALSDLSDSGPLPGSDDASIIPMPEETIQ